MAHNPTNPKSEEVATIASVYPQLYEAHRGLRRAVDDQMTELSPRERLLVRLTYALNSGSANAVAAAVRHSLDGGLSVGTIRDTLCLGLGRWDTANFCNG